MSTYKKIKVDEWLFFTYFSFDMGSQQGERGMELNAFIPKATFQRP